MTRFKHSATRRGVDPARISEPSTSWLSVSTSVPGSCSWGRVGHGRRHRKVRLCRASFPKSDCRSTPPGRRRGPKEFVPYCLHHSSKRPIPNVTRMENGMREKNASVARSPQCRSPPAACQPDTRQRHGSRHSACVCRMHIHDMPTQAAHT